MKLRTTMLAGVTLLVAAMIGATVIAVVVIVDRAERRTLREDLARSGRVFEDLLGYRHSVLHSDCRVVANEPRLRATVATQDISRETILGVISELRTSLGSDLFLLTDGAGTLLADTADAEAHGFDLSTYPVIAAALKTGEGSAVWVAGDRPHQVEACRVAFGERIVGVIAIGKVFDDAVAQTVQLQTGSTLVVGLDGRRVAASTLHDGTPVGDRALAIRSAEQTEVELGGTRYVGIGGAFPRYDGKRDLSYALVQSLDEALAPARRLTRGVLLIAGLALAAALALAIALSRYLLRPVDELVAFTRRVGGGQLDARAREIGATEVRALAAAMNTMTAELDKSRREMARTERLEKEMEIAMKIQTSILPRTFEVSGLDVAARMIPASEVGGDYYDVLPVAGGCWLGIGDVAGHGLTAGLEMLMVQSVIAALVRENPEAAPKDHLRVLNHVVFENIRNRLQQDEHITLTLLRYGDGRLTFAGAHEEIVVCRAAGGACERLATPGTWLGAIRDIGRVTSDTTVELAVGDLVVLYSDGITEARAADGTQFGIDSVCGIVETARTEDVAVIRDRVIAAANNWQIKQEDDMSIVVARRRS